MAHIHPHSYFTPIINNHFYPLAHLTDSLRLKTLKLRFDNTTEATPWAANTTIFEQGTTSECMDVLVEGEVSLLHDGEELTTLAAGTMFGEMALLEKRPHYATAIAKTDCKLVAINQKRFRFLVEQTPNFAIEVMTIMAERLDRMNQKATA